MLGLQHSLMHGYSACSDVGAIAIVESAPRWEASPNGWLTVSS